MSSNGNSLADDRKAMMASRIMEIMAVDMGGQVDDVQPSQSDVEKVANAAVQATDTLGFGVWGSIFNALGIGDAEQLGISDPEGGVFDYMNVTAAGNEGESDAQSANAAVLSVDDLSNVLGSSILSRMPAMLLDSHYICPTRDLWNQVFNDCNEIMAQYIPEYRDCDDYAMYMKGFASIKWGVNGSGVVLDVAGSHAYNGVVVWDPGSTPAVAIHVVEPQVTGDVNQEWIADDAVGTAPYSATASGFQIW